MKKWLDRYQSKGEVLTPAQQVALANSIAKNPMRINTPATAVPIIKQGYTPTPYTEYIREERNKEYARNKAMLNSDLAKTFSSFTPGGDNIDAGVIGAETFANLNPVVSGPVLATSRLAPAIMHPTNNAYWGADRSIGQNALGVLGAAGDVAMVRPALIPAKTIINSPSILRNSLANSMESGLLSNMWRLNPFANKLKKFNRVVGQDAVDDAISSGLIRSGEGAGPTKRPTAWPSFSKGAPKQTYINQVLESGETPYIISTDRPMAVSTSGRHGKGTTMFPIGEDYVHGSGNYLHSFPASEVKIYEGKPPHWLRGLRGYKPIETPSVIEQPFQSEIDWGKWNKEIPENAQLMDEYNAIEQTTKANGSWMKNPDGSEFKGTPEQFVQQNSENFKKAFLDYHGTRLNHNSNNELITFDESFFNTGAGDTGFYGKGIYTHPDKGYTKMYGKNNYELYLNSKNKGFLDKSNIYDAYYFKRSDNEILQHYLPEYENKLMNYKLDPNRYYDNAKENWLNKLNEQVKAGKTSRDKLDKFTSLHIPRNGEVVIPFSNRVKSAIGNNGMFDMTNPNIYKGLIPPAILLGAGAATQQKQQGGELDRYQSGREVKYNVPTGDNLQYRMPVVSNFIIQSPSELSQQFIDRRTTTIPSGIGNPIIDRNNFSNIGINKEQLKTTNKYLKNKASALRQQEIEDYKAAELFHKYNPVAQLLGTRTAPVGTIKPTAREMAYGAGAAAEDFMYIPKAGPFNEMLNIPDMMYSGVIAPWLKAPLEAQQSNSNTPYLMAGLSAGLSLGDMAATTHILNPTNKLVKYYKHIDNIQDLKTGTDRYLKKEFTSLDPDLNAPHIYQDMYPINGRYQPRTVITDAGVKNKILGLEPTPVVPTNTIEYPVTPNKFLNQTYDDFGRMEEGVVNNITPSTQKSVWNNILGYKPIETPSVGDVKTLYRIENPNIPFDPNKAANFSNQEKYIGQFFSDDIDYVSDYLRKNQSSPGSRLVKVNIPKSKLKEYHVSNYPDLTDIEPQNWIIPKNIKREYIDLGELPVSGGNFIKINQNKEAIKKLIETSSVGNSFMPPPKQLGFIGAGAATQQKQQGGAIITNRGQWDYPGQTTIIPSNEITMRGVDYPVLGIDNTGHQIMMQPGMNYTFPGQYVTEYPIMQKGGQMSIEDIKNAYKTAAYNYNNRIFPKETLAKRQAAYNTINPTDYTDLRNYGRWLSDEQRDVYSDPRSEEAWKFYLGLNKPEDLRYLRKSKYKPTINATQKNYYSVDPDLEQDLFNAYKDKVELNKTLQTDESELETPLSGDSGVSMLGRFGVSRGQDEKGDYLSYYDKYDLKNFAQKRTKGVPYSIYGRIYYPEKEQGGEMIKRADGSYSRRGLWDNIRANKGSGKAPTKEMLEQERKINNKYQGGGQIPTVQGNFKKQNKYGYWVTDEAALAKEAQRLNSKKVLTENGSLIIFNDNWHIVAVDDNPNASYKQGGVVLNAGGEKHRIYVKSTNRGEGAKGHIMVNHPTMDKGIWDTIDLTEKAGATTIAQGVAATKKWHKENPYKKQSGGEKDVYWRTRKPMVNDPSMDAISKVLLYRNQDKNFMQRAAGFGNQGGIPTKYISGQDPESENYSSLLMAWDDDSKVFPSIIETAPQQLSYLPKQRKEYIETPSWDVADYFSTKGYKRAANDMYGMEYQDGGEEKIKFNPLIINKNIWSEPNYVIGPNPEGHYGYNGTDTINYNPDDVIENINNPWWLGHEKYHHYQTLSNNNPKGKRQKERDNKVNQMIKKSPELQFIPRDILIKGIHQDDHHIPGAEDLMYEDPNTLEGAARLYENYIRAGNNPLFANGGYVVRRSHDRKGKTHVVIGPDGTKKYFGDSKMGQHPNDPARKKAFYARHKHNLEHNPYFRAFARATWKEGGETYAIGGQSTLNPIVKKDNRNWLDYLKN